MKAILSIITVFVYLLLVSCTDRGERDYVNFNVSIKNNSSESLVIKGYAPNNDLIINTNVESNSVGAECNYSFEYFSGYNCGIDSIVIKFSNGKGYISSLHNPSIYDFPNDNNPFGNSPKFIIDNGVYEFTINQEDFINAFDLP
jgi:hypothetical protein